MQALSSIVETIDRNISALQCGVSTSATVCNSFLDAMDQTIGLTSYKHFPVACHKIWDSSVVKEGEMGRRAFLAVLILLGIKRTLMGNFFSGLPVRVQAGQAKHFQWLASNITGSEDWLDLENDTFQKEIGAAMLHLYVCGSQMVEYRSGLPRLLVLKEGLGKSISNAKYFARLGGFKPYFQIHMHVHLRDQFNEVGRRECYHCCAELFSIHPDILGMFGVSWFYDPVVAKISPRLSFLQEEPIRGGAHVFRWETSERSTRDALFASATRRSLAAQGLYIPCSYFLVWDKASQLQWAAATKV